MENKLELNIAETSAFKFAFTKALRHMHQDIAQNGGAPFYASETLAELDLNTWSKILDATTNAYKITISWRTKKEVIEAKGY